MDTYHITFDDGRWVLSPEGSEPLFEYTTRAEAELHSRELLRRRGGALKIHKSDGTMDEERTFDHSGGFSGNPSAKKEKPEPGWEDQPMPGLSPYTFHV